MRTTFQKKAKRNRLDECTFGAHAMLTAAQTGAMIFMRLGKYFSPQAKAAVLILSEKGVLAIRVAVGCDLVSAGEIASNEAFVTSFHKTEKMNRSNQPYSDCNP